MISEIKWHILRHDQNHRVWICFGFSGVGVGKNALSRDGLMRSKHVLWGKLLFTGHGTYHIVSVSKICNHAGLVSYWLKRKKKNNFLWRDGYKYICVLCVGWNSVVFSDKLLGSQSLISCTIKPELAVVKHCCLQQSVWSNTPSRDQTIMLVFF